MPPSQFLLWERSIGSIGWHHEPAKVSPDSDHMGAPQTASAFPSWLILIGAMTALGPFSIDMYLPGFPQIEAEFNESGVERTMAAYLAGIAIGQLFYGPVSDRLGRKPPLYAGLLLYALGALGCALARSMWMLMAMRVVQAIGGCAALVIGRAIVRDRCEPHEAARAFSTLMLVVSVGPIVAPSLGGWVITILNWRAVFIFQFVAGLALLLAMHALLTESLVRKSGSMLRFASAALDYWRLLQDRSLVWYSLVSAFGMSALFCYVTGAPKVMMGLYGLTPQQFGWVIGLNGLAFMSASRINVLLLRRRTPEVLVRKSVWMPLGMGILMTLIAAVQARPPLPLLIVLQLLFFVSVARIGPNVSALALASHGRNAGAASAVMGALQSLVPMAAGIAVAAYGNGTVLTLGILMTIAVLLSALSYLWARVQRFP